MPYKQSAPLESLFDEAPLDLALLRAAERAQDRLMTLVKRYTPVSNDPGSAEKGRAPGTLRDSWQEGEVEILASGRLRVTVFTERPEAPHVEYPTRPHLITPRADRAPASVVSTQQPRGDASEETPTPALRFYVDGRVVYAREVMHPGTQGSFMMHRAIDQMRLELPRILGAELRRAYSVRGRAEASVL